MVYLIIVTTIDQEFLLWLALIQSCTSRLRQRKANRCGTVLGANIGSMCMVQSHPHVVSYIHLLQVHPVISAV